MNETSTDNRKVALLGYSVAAMEALDEAGTPFVAVVPPDFGPYMEENKLDHVLWDFNLINEKSTKLAESLKEKGVKVAVPLFEETVEWAGALNGQFRDDPRLFTRYLLFRDKAMMKRRAQMSGIRVGVFEEAETKEDVHRFFGRVNKALTKIEGDQHAPIHLKPLAAAGSVGHRFIREENDIEKLTDADFPGLLETHLEGQEFSCEVFIHNRKIQFLNITEYIHLGHSNFVPCSPSLNEFRPQIEKAIYDLISAFDVEYGMIHPEFFITPDGQISFGEVAARVPGGHIFELIEQAYEFSPFTAFALCSDPETPQSVLDDFFPKEDEFAQYAGCLMVYPKQRIVTKAVVPESLINEPFYSKHHLFQPVNQKVADRDGFGDHYGTIYFKGDDPEVMRQLLLDYEEVDFYASEES